jgi:hypothetical protein
MELLPIILVGLTIAKMISPEPIMINIHWGTLVLFRFIFPNGLDAAILVTGISLLVVTLITIIFVKETPLEEKPTTPFWPPMVRVLGMLGGILIGGVAGLLGGGLVGGLTGLVIWAVTGIPIGWDLSAFPPLIYPTTLPAAIIIGVGGGVAMIVAVVIGVQAGCLGTLGKEARKQFSFVWWITNRLMFLAAATSLQGSILFFVMYAFNLSNEGATSLSGTLTSVIGVFILISALASGWLSDRLGRKRLVLVSGILAAAGNAMLLITIWLPNLIIIYVAGTIIGLATGLFMTANWALGTDLVPAGEAGRYLGISNLAGAGAGIIGAGIGGLVADAINHFSMGRGYFAIFAAYALLFALSTVTLLGMREVKK